jgi:hypothetical protein
MKPKKPSAKSKKKTAPVAKKGKKEAQKKPKKADVGRQETPQDSEEPIWLKDEILFQERLLLAHEAEIRATCEVEWLDSQTRVEPDNEGYRRGLARSYALERLVKVGNRICELLSEIVEHQPDLATSVASKASSWPVALCDVPNLDIELKAMLERLKIGQTTDEPYDPIRASRKPSRAKDIAIKLTMILYHFDNLQEAKEEVDHGKGMLAHSQGDEKAVRVFQRKLDDLLAGEAEDWDDCFEALTDLAHFLGRDQPEQVAINALDCMQDKWGFDQLVPDESMKLKALEHFKSLGIATAPGADFIVKRKGCLVDAANGDLEPELQLLWYVADNDPERLSSRHGIGQSKARVPTREDGTTPAGTRKGNIKAGINGEIRQALKSIARQR